MSEQVKVSTSSSPPASPQRWGWVRYAAAILLAVGISLFIFLNADKIEELAGWGYMGVFVISIASNATLILPAPGFAAVFAFGGVLNPLLVGVVAGVGAAIGEMTGYLAGYGGSAVISRYNVYDRLEALMRRWGAWIIFALAAIPNPIFDVGGLMAGSLKMPWWKFLLAASVGKSLRFVVIALVGAWGVSLFV